MPDFTYRAVDEQGKVINNVISAADEAELETMLREKGSCLIEASPKGERKKQKIPGRVKRQELIDFCAGMAYLLNAGVSIVDALTEISRETRNILMEHTLGEVVNSIESGESLHDSLARHPKVFSSQIINLVRAGEQTGDLAITFAELKNYLEWLARLFSSIKQASLYPITILIAVSLFMMLLFTFVVPKFAKLFTSLDIALPLPTYLIMEIGDMMVKTWWMWLSGIFILFFLLKFLPRYFPKVEWYMDLFKLNLPVFGELHRMIALSRLTRNLSVLLRAGVPLMEALSLCRSLTGTVVISHAVEAAEKEIAEGESMREALHHQKIFPTMLLRMVAIGESTGELDKAFEHAASYYDEEIPRRIKKVFGIMEPVLMLVLIGIVGTVALAIFMPLLSLMGEMG